jgi:hypothetical protein
MPVDSTRHGDPRWVALLSLALLCFSASAGRTAEPPTRTLTLGPAGLQFSVPGDWIVDADSFMSLIAGRPQKTGGDGLSGFAGFFMLFYPTGKSGIVRGPDALPVIVEGHIDVDDFLENVAIELEMRNVRKAKVTSGPTKEQVNELTQHHMEGTGVYYPSGKGPGTDVHWDLALVAGAKKNYVMVAIGKDLDSNVIEDVYKSIRRD